MIKFIECPRDAMQGIKEFIPTEKKIKYLQSLLNVGFDILDCVSFVSPKAIPQLADSREVIEALDISKTNTELLAIVLNQKGAEIAAEYSQIKYLGFPFSISETFQQNNGNSTISDNYDRLVEVSKISNSSNKSINAYISMGFGNNYGENYSVDMVSDWVDKISQLGISTFSISDTVGKATPELITEVYSTLIAKFPYFEFGAHLHSAAHNWLPKVKAAFKSGCRRFDVAIGGVGGCPFADDELVGNLATEYFVNFYSDKFNPNFNFKAFEDSVKISKTIF